MLEEREGEERELERGSNHDISSNLGSNHDILGVITQTVTPTSYIVNGDRKANGWAEAAR